MDSFEWNKIFAGVLISLIFIMLGEFLSSFLINPDELEKNVFVVDVPETNPFAENTAEKKLAPIGPMLASASIENGQAVFKKCLQCHSPNKGGPNKTGPNLWNIVDSPFGKKDGFAYSKALLAMGDMKWTVENLNQFLHKPRKFMKGTKMSFVGLKKDQDRADVIAYLQSLR